MSQVKDLGLIWFNSRRVYVLSPHCVFPVTCRIPLRAPNITLAPPKNLRLTRSLRSNMSSLSRRSCYKCGNLGHYAEVCSSSERLCYNCKQPGHESNQCPHPRTTETKQCYSCMGLG